MLRRFGNYIGEAEESEEELRHGESRPDAYAYDLESEEDEEAGEGPAHDQQLMELDGNDHLRTRVDHIFVSGY